MKRKVLTYLIVAMISLLCNINKIFAMPLTTEFYINNTKMTSSNKIYTAGNANVNLSIRVPGSSTLDKTLYQYGYAAICSATGSLRERYINTISSSILTNLAVINSTVGCTIPGTSSYYNTARVVYVSFVIPYSNFDCGNGGGVCDFVNSLNFAWYQPGSTEYSIISWGFKNTPYDLNSTVDPSVIQGDTIINQNATIIEQNSQINSSINSVNSSINGLKDADYNGSTEQPNKNEYDIYKNKEEDIFDAVEDADMDNIDIAIDDDSSSFVWDTMTSLLQSNSYVFGLMISILSIGILKLVLGR